MQVISIFQEMSDANKCYSNDMSWILIVETGLWGISGKIGSGEEKEDPEAVQSFGHHLKGPCLGGKGFWEKDQDERVHEIES